MRTIPAGKAARSVSKNRAIIENSPDEQWPVAQGDFAGGLRYNENVIAVGAQTVRRGDAWPVRGLLGGKDLTGRFLGSDQLRLSYRQSGFVFESPGSRA